jgi:diaminopimelate epimerase
MCGNGGRCLVAFAKKLKIIDNSATFMAIDGFHHATIYDGNNVSLQMKDVDTVKSEPDYTFLDTGSPHHVEVVSSILKIDVKSKGAEIRYGGLYGFGWCQC